MHYDLRHHASQEEAEQAQSKSEVGPVMTVLHDL